MEYEIDEEDFTALPVPNWPDEEEADQIVEASEAVELYEGSGEVGTGIGVGVEEVQFKKASIKDWVAHPSDVQRFIPHVTLRPVVHISRGNAKLGTLPNFNLPPRSFIVEGEIPDDLGGAEVGKDGRIVTCPGATRWCRWNCYAQKGQFTANASVIMREYAENFMASLRPDFVDTAVAGVTSHGCSAFTCPGTSTRPATRGSGSRSRNAFRTCTSTSTRRPGGS